MDALNDRNFKDFCCSVHSHELDAEELAEVPVEEAWDVLGLKRSAQPK